MRSRKTILKSVIIPVVLGIGLWTGCDDNGPTRPEVQTAKVRGSVAANGGFQKQSLTTHSAVDSAIVFLTRVKTDGSIEVISSDSALTDHSGGFVIETAVNGESNLVVQAEKNGDTWKGVVSAAVQHGSTVNAQPLNIETTVEAEVYSRVKAHGKSDLVLYTDVAMQTDSSIALAIQNNANAINNFAVAIEEMVEARNVILTDTAVAATQAQVAASNSVRAQAQRNLEAALFTAGGSQADIQTAFDAFYEAELDAYIASGINATGCAKARETAGVVLIKNSGSLSAAARFAIARKNAQIRAAVLARAAQQEFVHLGASSTRLNAVANAGATLAASIDASSNVNQIEAAFEDYHDAILSELTGILNAQASTINSLDATINSPLGLKAALRATVNASVSTQAVVDAYMTFYQEITALVKSSLTTLSAAEVEAATHILILINMQI